MLQETADGLYCPAGDFYIDPWGAVPRAVITHAHGDHARAGSSSYFCVDTCGPLLKRRFGADIVVETRPYGDVVSIGSTRVSFHPAGHILGSSQVRVEGLDGVWVVSGDYKRAADPTCPPFEPVRCNTFVTESTFGLPIFHWDPAAAVVAQLVNWWSDNRAAGRASVVFCYTLGKAQRILAELARITDRRVLVHGAMLSMIEAYREAGVKMLDTSALIERPRGSSAAGELILAPLLARGTPWMRRLGEFSDAFASGTMRVRGAQRQRNVDRGLVLSDHADWPALLETVRDVGASRVLVTHGHSEAFSRYLASQGIESGVIRTAWEGEAAVEGD
ncbi:MAG TPA: ligase-associated DNA damage response exonuclease [Vicinamibacterales bacterium]